MKAIIGENLRGIFKKLGLDARLTYSGKIGVWSHFEVWEITDEVLEKLSDISDEEWDALCQDISVNSWWRYSEGSNMDKVNAIFTINGQKIVAWRNKYKVEDLFTEYFELDEEEKKEYADAEDYVNTWLARGYKGLMEYFAEELHVSNATNVCALATDLAEYNGMGLGELFAIYGGKNG
jgi:hypothetical protein